MPTLLTRRKAALGRPISRGRAGVAGVPSSGHASKGILQEPRRARHPLSQRVTGRQGKPEATGTVDEQSYEPVVPRKVGNRRASARSGHGTHWREGANKRTWLAPGFDAANGCNIHCRLVGQGDWNGTTHDGECELRRVQEDRLHHLRSGSPGRPAVWP